MSDDEAGIPSALAEGSVNKDTQLVFDDIHTLQRYAFLNAVDPLVFKMYMKDFEGTRNLALTMKSVKGADIVLVSLHNIINCKII